MSNQPAQAATPAATPAAVEKVKEPSPTDQANELSQLHKSFGRISLENTETNYVEGSHWTAILDGVRPCVHFCPPIFFQSANVFVDS